MKIVGAENYPPEMLRNEVACGAKFVVYSYNFSLVVMSFKRPSSIYYIHPGQNRIVKGLPFTLISLLVGWWGIPWGIIYTIQTLATNLSGGVDVTDSVMASLAPAPAAGKPTSPPTLRPAPVGKPMSFRRMLPAAGVVVGLIAIVYTIVCFFYGRNLRVALVSGLKNAYSVELNGQKYQLLPNHPQLLTLSEGNLELRGAPGDGGVQSISARTSFFARPFGRHVLVINPDRTALVCWQTARYHSDRSSSPESKDDGLLVIHANTSSYYLPEPDYFFEEFPRTISMPVSARIVAKTRLVVPPGMSIYARASVVSDKLGYASLRDYLANVARIEPEDDVLQRLIVALLKPDDARAIFESRLDDRPVLVEWHRAYEYLMDTHFPEVDLAPRYRKWYEADRDDGALTYLYGRLFDEPTITRDYFGQAMRAKKPCAYGAYGLSADAFADGRYEESLEFATQAEKAGLHSDALELRKHDALLALRRVGDVLALVGEKRAKDPTDAGTFADQLILTQAQKPDRLGGEREIAGFIAGLKAKFGADDYQMLQRYLDGRLAYALGEEQEAGALLAKVDGPLNQFESAVDLRHCDAAAKALAQVKEAPAHLYFVLMLAADASGNTAAADQYFKQGVASLGQSDHYSRLVAKALSGDGPVDHRVMLRMQNFAGELRIFYTAFGVHFPEQRKTYFARAAELDQDPSFPHLLLKNEREKNTPPLKPAI